MNPVWRRLFLASLRQRPLASVLSLSAIALGVALGLAVQLIHAAALDEFDRGMRRLTGDADLLVTGSREGFDDALFITLAQRPEVAAASPVLEIEARLPAHDDSLRIFAVDVFRLPGLGAALMPQPAAGAEPADEVGEGGGEGAMFAALAPQRIFLSAAAAQRLGLSSGAQLRVQSGLSVRALTVSGTVPAAGVGQALGVMDVAAAQQLFGRIGVLTRIDLRLAAGVQREEARARLAALLPPGVHLVAPEQAAAQVQLASRAYRVNLAMLAAMALLTGAFLVFTTQMLSIARRRPTLAFLRALGMTRGELLRGLLGEGAVLGFLGGVAGVGLGHALAALALVWLGGDLGAGYFRDLGPALHFSPLTALVFVALGVCGGVAGSALPAGEAAALVPAQALRARDELGLPARARWRAAVACAVVAVVLCQLPPLGGLPWAGYAAVAAIVCSAVLALPGATALAAQHLPGRGVLWRLARARLGGAPGQGVVAASGVVVSVALAVSMAIMVNAFRLSLDDWLSRMLPADLYLQASSSAASGHLDPVAVAAVARVHGVAAVEPIRAVQLVPDPGQPPLTLIARPIAQAGDLPLVEGQITLEEIEAGDERPPVWVSEAVADRYALRSGAGFALPLQGRQVQVRVAGIWRDYARQHGAIVMDLERYRRLSGDMLSNDLAVRVQPGADPGVVAQALQAVLDGAGGATVKVASATEIRSRSLKIFDRSFLVTYLMEAVAVLIGLAGIVASFAALAVARRREFGMLRHLGLTRAELGRLMALEGGLCAGLGVVIGVLAGAAVAWVLIHVVNRQSFHWSMDFHWPGLWLAVLALTLILFAAAAARLAAGAAMRQDAVRAVREDW